MKIELTTTSLTGRSKKSYTKLSGLAGSALACPTYGFEFDFHLYQNLLYTKLIHIIKCLQG